MSTNSKNTPIDRLSFHQGHDSAIAYSINGKFYNISIEKLRNMQIPNKVENKTIPNKIIKYKLVK